MTSAIQFLPGLVMLTVLSVVSGLIDVREHRISNKVLLIALTCGFFWLGFSAPSIVVSYGVAGAGVALALLLPLHIVGPLGAGDVKLAAVSGLFLGPGLAAAAVALSLVLGGIAALVVYYYATRNHQLERKGSDGATHSTVEAPRPGSMLLPFGFAVGSGFSAVGLYQYAILMGAL